MLRKPSSHADLPHLVLEQNFAVLSKGAQGQQFSLLNIG